jgi:glycosyltransferase involved in cell wall biosynthesis
MKKKLLIISSYPSKGSTHGNKFVGVATYAKNTVLGIEKASKDLEITVIAEKLNGEQNYKEGKTTVKRVWTRYSISSYYSILREIVRNHEKDEKVLIELELSMFGGMLSLLVLPLFILMLRSIGKEVHITIHQVITDMKEVSGHINATNDIVINTFSTLIRLFYLAILKSVSKAIVFDQILKDRLVKISKSSASKITVIPHGVEEFKAKISRDEARKKLGIQKDEFVILYFGFIAWYKGADQIIDYFNPSPKNKLILAGGSNPNHLNKNFYSKYVKSVEKKAKKKGVLVTGFVPEDQICQYFQACDLVVFPYRALISASGPLSMAFSFNKPFLISSKLKDIFNTSDLKSALSANKIGANELVFSNAKEFEAKIAALKTDAVSIKSLSKEMAKRRNWNKIGKLYYNQIYA